ncbi:hypothetical protein E4T56_gene3284 [Termitomyces sp. T112]|nr:hypothetical protein E4T56_gene3284 [Termitomyces sp. T112]
MDVSRYFLIVIAGSGDQLGSKAVLGSSSCNGFASAYPCNGLALILPPPLLRVAIFISRYHILSMYSQYRYSTK